MLLPTDAANRYQLTAAQVAAAWTEQTRGIVLASPSNPTGTSIDPAEMQALVETVRARGGSRCCFRPWRPWWFWWPWRPCPAWWPWRTQCKQCPCAGQ